MPGKQVIEHLPSEEVAYEAGRVIFGALRPRVAVISTPNAECNVRMVRCAAAARGCLPETVNLESLISA